MPEPVVLTTKLLMDTGGWKEMKQARLLHGAGAVEEARFQKGVLEGVVTHQGKARKIRVDIKTRTWWDNHSTCPLSRRDGAVCAHALAVALQVIDPIKATAAATPEVSGSASPIAATAAKPQLSPDWPKITEPPDDPEAISAQLFIILAPQVAASWQKGRLMAGIEIEIEGGH